MDSSLDKFKSEIDRLSRKFVHARPDFKSEGFNESALRIDYLNPLWRALGWDVENRENRPQQLREVEVETRVDVFGRKKRADYIFPLSKPPLENWNDSEPAS